MTRFWWRVVAIALGTWLGLMAAKVLTVGRDEPCNPLHVWTCEP